jgi:hypothetical protein
MLERRIAQVISFKDRIAAFAKEAIEKASLLPPGAEKDELLLKARRARTASHLDDWANSPGLQSPRE